MSKRKMGRYTIHKDSFDSSFDLVRRVVSEAPPVNVEYDFSRNCFIYTAVSNHFDELGEMEIAPMYSVIITEMDSSHPVVTFKRGY